MILMLISDNSKTETRSIVRYTKDFAGKRTEEMWKMRTCDNVGELEQAVAEKIKANKVSPKRKLLPVCKLPQSESAILRAVPLPKSHHTVSTQIPAIPASTGFL